MKLVVALPLPCDPMLDVRTAAWLTALGKHPLVQPDWAQSQSVDENRNKIIYKHLQNDPDMTHMFFLDSDTVPGVDAVQLLMDLNMPIATGICPMLMPGSQLAWNVRLPDGRGWWPVERALPRTPFTTKHTGGACLLVERNVLETMGWPWFQRCEGHPSGGLQVGCSGDVFFCEKAGKAGLQIWAHPAVKCSHWKKIDLLALAMRGEVFEAHEEAFAGASTIAEDPEGQALRREQQTIREIAEWARGGGTKP